MKFKGFDDWIEIFRGGKQIDSKGMEWNGEDLIEKAVSNFDPKTHEPPLTVGHPADNAPAFGWVEGLKKIVKDGVPVLLAKFKQVVPEFATAVMEGLFKKRSASFYPDGRLRHVGFLGAAPPAVKALADLKFESGDAAVFDFTDDHPHQQKEDGKMMFKDFWEVMKFWKQVEADPSLELPLPVGHAGKAPAPAAAGEAKSFTEADVEAAKKAAAEAERKKVAAEFAEKGRQADREARKTAIKAWYDQNLAAGKIAPAWGDAGLLAFMDALDAETPAEFSEGKKQSAFDWFKGFMESLPKVIEFKEIARRDKDVKAGAAGPKLAAYVSEKLKAQPTLTYGAAFAEVQKEHPDLADEYAREIRKEE